MKSVPGGIASLMGFVLLAACVCLGCSGTKGGPPPPPPPGGNHWTVYLQINGGLDGKDGPHLAVEDSGDTTHKVPHVNGKRGDEITFIAMDASFRVHFDEKSPFLDSTRTEIQCFDVQKGIAGARTFRVRDDFPGCSNCCLQAKYHIVRSPSEPLPQCPVGPAWVPCDTTFKEIGPVVDGDG